MSNNPSGLRRARRYSAAVVASAALIIPLAACRHRPPHRPPTSGPNTTHATRPPTSGPTTRPPANEATVELMNGMIMIQGSIKPGRNTLHFTNTGTVEHEVIFVKADDGATLPTLPNGAWDEDAMPPGSIIGEVELEAGQSTTRTFTFSAGKWVGVCNVVSGTTSHYKNGMWLNFTVS
jgi:hypothetical protein